MTTTLNWQDFRATDDEIEFLNTLLFEGETPLSIIDLSRALVETRINAHHEALKAQFQNIRFYAPSQSFNVGQHIAFPAFGYTIAEVIGIRDGDNPEYGDFRVIQVQFDESDLTREFAAELQAAHALNDSDPDGLPLGDMLSVDEVIAQHGAIITQRLSQQLADETDLISLAGKWFSRSLMMDVNEGYLNLAEAVLDIAEGKPMPTPDILDQIGGLGSAPRELQLFCLNDALNRDERFDEVGSLDIVLWFLRSNEPEAVLKTPDALSYVNVPYDSQSLTPEQIALEEEIADEWSPRSDDLSPSENALITLTYPHWRSGTMPLNAQLASIFPTARKSPRIAVTLVDEDTGEEYPGWVVRSGRYVHGLESMYRHHDIPIGTRISAHRATHSDKVMISFKSHKPRTEWVRMLKIKEGQIVIEDVKRPVGVEFDDLMLFDVALDNIPGFEALMKAAQQSNRPLMTIIRNLMTELTKTLPQQGTVHAKTLYSLVNVVRRCPPGMVFAALNGDPTLEDQGSNYWKMV